MSVDINWDAITSGPDGDQLAENVRDFVHDKFQQISLPRFIKSVHVHSFDFGSACPEIEIKDICDPMPDFYEDDESEDEEEADLRSTLDGNTPQLHRQADSFDLRNDVSSADPIRSTDSTRTGHVDQISASTRPLPPRLVGDFRSAVNVRQSQHAAHDQNSGPFLRSGTPGILGGTSNLNYFHLPVGGLSGTQTPLAAVASGTPFSPGPWLHEFSNPSIPHFGHSVTSPIHPGEVTTDRSSQQNPTTRPSTATSLPSPPETGSPIGPSSPETNPVTFSSVEKVSDDPTMEDLTSPPPLKLHQTNPSDVQVVSRIKYSGDVRMTLTAEILLDYPMPSFVSIPVRLAITGVTFDGVAVLAYMKKRMHFCFLDPEDAETLVGGLAANDDDEQPHNVKDRPRNKFSSLLQEIRVESEIGRQENGKQVLKNVGKVEKFVLEQIRKIFEDELVFPSFWTFLV